MLSEHTISLFNKSVLFNTVSRSGHLILWDVLIIVYLGHKFFEYYFGTILPSTKGLNDTVG